MPPNPAPKNIIHLDMDYFFAAVEILDNPALKGLPIIVGGLGNRGVVSTASYEARALGVHSALPISTARRRCPQGVYLRPRMARYKEVSDQIMAIFQRYTPLVEPLSLDEAFLDVTGSKRLFGPPEAIARQIKADVFNETGLTVTAGVASQKHLAKIASGKNKPDGLTIVPHGGELDFLWPLPITDLWGVGQVTARHLKALGLETVGQVAALEQSFMEKRFGQVGAHLWALSNGLDSREVISEHQAKSVGAEETYGQDLTDPEDIKGALLAQTMTAVRRMRHQGLTARTITVKFRDGRFQTRTRAVSLSRPTDKRDEVYREVLAVYEKEAPSLGPLRLVGVSLSRLGPPGESETGPAPPMQLNLFDQPPDQPPAMGGEKSSKINQVLDQIEIKFGVGAVRPATLVSSTKKEKP